MTVQEFVKTFAEKKIMNTRINENAVSEYLRKELDIKSYIPFRVKREIAEMIAAQNIKVVDGIKKHDDIDSYVSLIVASIAAHTTLEFSEDPVADYDLLAESGLLLQIISEFQSSHEEIGLLLKMTITSELEDNNINVLVGKFLDGILQRLDIVGEVLKDKLGDLNLKDVLGADFKQEDLAKLQGFLNKYIK